ncbi:MAG TPA: epoxide hydrolase [Acidimicrobiales bacterium]
MSIEPFRIEVPDDEIAELRRRIRATRWPDELPDAGWDYGTDLAVLRQVARYWADEYDWRVHEAELNNFPQYVTTIDGQRVHFLHVRSPHANALPLVLTHGWPGSIYEFTKVIGPLTDPGAHGGDPADAFHVVVPSLPGYGFSGPVTERGWDVRRVARAWAALMDELGYQRYGAQGGDWGSMVSRHLADLAPDRVCGVHLNFITASPPGEPDDYADLTPREAAMFERAKDYMTRGNGYVAIQSTRPQTLAYALTDSPVGLLSWILEKFWAWTDNNGDPFEAVTPDELLTNVSIYWFTRTAGSSARMYYESLGSNAVRAPSTKKVPLGVANFPMEIMGARRAWIERDNDLVHWTEHDRGGHFAALEEPDLFVDDVRAFFRLVR